MPPVLLALPPVTLLPSLPMLVPVRPLPYNPAWNLIVCCFADEYEGSDCDSSDSDLLLRAPCNVVTSGCGELWTSAPSPHMPEYHGHYVTQQFLDDEDGETMIGEFGKDDLQGVQVGDHVWTFGGEWTTDDIFLIEVTQEELDENDMKIRFMSNFDERCVLIPVPTLALSMM